MAQESKNAKSEDTPNQDGIALFLGGSSRKHAYVCDNLNKYGKRKMKYVSLSTKNCLNAGAKAYYKHLKSKINVEIIAVITLMDCLGSFSDELNTLYGIPCNSMKSSHVRNNKFLQHEWIKKSDKNILYAKHFIVDNINITKIEFEKLMKENELEYPIVIKPINSGGTDGVRLCSNFNGIYSMIQKLFFKENAECLINTELMIMEYLRGNEYVVNCVSHNGIHKCTDIWMNGNKYVVKDNPNNNEAKDDNNSTPCNFLYDYQEFVMNNNDNSNIVSKIVEYVFNVLDICDITYGCSHTEVMLLDNGEVCLIELNARMHGGMPRCTKLIGYDQLSTLALSIMDSNKFIKTVPTIYKSIDDDKSVRAVFLKVKRKGKFNFKKLLDLKNLKTFDFYGRQLWNFDVNYKYCLDKRQEYMDEINQLLTINISLNENKANNNDTTNNSGNNVDTNGDSFADNNGLMIITQIEGIQDKIDEINKQLNWYENVNETNDLISSPGCIVLYGNKDDILKDYKYIRNIENMDSNGLYIFDD